METNKQIALESLTNLGLYRLAQAIISECKVDLKDTEQDIMKGLREIEYFKRDRYCLGK